MSKKIQAVIFDWAGTTVDYGCFAPVVTFLEIFKDCGIELTLEEVLGPMGIHKKEHIKLLLQLERIKQLWVKKFGKEPGDIEVDDLYVKFEPILINQLKDYATPNPYVVAVVEKLKASGIKIGSTTGYIRKMMDELIPYAKKNGYSPDNVVTSDEVISGRPHPFMCYKNAMDLGIYPFETVIKAGDTIADIKEGVNASMWSVGIIMGSSIMGMTKEEVENCPKDILESKIKHVEEVFYKNGAHFVILDMRELLPLIDKINIKLENGEKP